MLLAIIVRVDKERREDRNGIAHLELLTVFTPYKVDDVNPILLPAVGWEAAATLVVMFPKNVVCELCLMLAVALKCGFTS